MKYKSFGSTELKVSEIGFGCARIGGVFSASGTKKETITLLQSAFDAGITFFDTADMYSQGESEVLLGTAFKKNRDKVVVASKGGYTLSAQKKLISRIKPFVKPLIKLLPIKRENLPTAVTGSIDQDFSPDYLTNALHASLKRLNTDYLDLYQLHSVPTELIATGEFIPVLETFQKQGKVRYFGITVDTTEAAVACLKYPQIASVQLPFGLLDQEPLEMFFNEAETRSLAAITRGCFVGGLLKESFSKEDLQEIAPNWAEILSYRNLALENGRSPLEFALQFSLSVPAITTTLLGIRTAAQLQSNLALYNAPPLTEAEFLNAINYVPQTDAAG